MFHKQHLFTSVVLLSALLLLVSSCKQNDEATVRTPNLPPVFPVERQQSPVEQTSATLVPIENLKSSFMATTDSLPTTPITVIAPTTTGISSLIYPTLFFPRTLCKIAPVTEDDDNPIIEDHSVAQGDGPVLSGLDVLEKEHFKTLKNKNLAFLVNHSSINKKGTHLLDLLRKEPGIKMKCMFSPEHGLFGNVDTHVSDFIETRTQLQVYSLYGKKPEGGKSGQPTKEQLKGIDAVVVDMQDIGARFYTYPAYMAYLMEICAKLGIEVIVLDRPNPIGGLYVDGPYQDDDMIGRTTAYIKMPVAHGMTMGELANMFNKENNINCKLTVVKMKNWKRSMLWDETGLRWVNPSPNIRDLDAALLYPGIGMTERILSMGRGTTEPFHIVGAPFVGDVSGFIDDVHKNMKGVHLDAITFTPSGTAAKGHIGENKECKGVRITVTDRKELRAVELGIRLMAFLHQQYGDLKKSDKDKTFAPVYDVMKVRASCSALTCAQIRELTTDKRSMDNILDTINKQKDEFMKTRAKYLMYE